MAHLPDSWSHALDTLAAPIGIPQDQARMIFCLIAAIPLGFIHKQLPSATAKHTYSFLLGFFISWFVVGNGAFHVLLASVLVYAAAYTLPRRLMPYWVSAAMVSYLSFIHIYRQYTNYLGWEMDVSLIQMIFVVKACTFVFNVADGLAINASDAPLHSKSHIHKHRADRALITRLSLLEYLSYIWYFGGVLVGPCFEAREYIEFTDLTLFQRMNLPGPPPSLLPSLRQVGIALLCYPFVYVHGQFPILGFVNTKSYAALPFWSRFVYFWVTMTCSRFKYYFVWYLAAAGCVSSGLGLSKAVKCADGSVKYEWNRCSNADAVAVETATSMPHITNNWNMGVNNWLKHYVYFRVEPSPQLSRRLGGLPTKSLANIITKLTSAFWHGFYPSYYLFFLGAFVVNEMDDAMRARLRPLLTGETKEAALSATADDSNGSNVSKGAKGANGSSSSGNTRQRVGSAVYGVIAWFCIFFCMNQLGMAFMLFAATWSIDFWASWYFVVFWAPAVVIALCYTVLPKPKSERGKGGKEKAVAGDGGKEGGKQHAKGQDETNGRASAGKKEL